MPRVTALVLCVRKSNWLPWILWLVMNSPLLNTIPLFKYHFEHAYFTPAQTIESFLRTGWDLNDLSIGWKFGKSNSKIASSSSSAKGPMYREWGFRNVWILSYDTPEHYPAHLNLHRWILELFMVDFQRYTFKKCWLGVCFICARLGTNLSHQWLGIHPKVLSILLSHPGMENSGAGAPSPSGRRRSCWKMG